MTHPTSFTGAPALGSHHPAPTPASAPVYQGPVSVPAPAEPRLTVRANGDVTLSKALLCAVPHLHGAEPDKEGSAVFVVVPTKRGKGWYLDTRPKPGTGMRLPDARQVARFRIPAPSRTHFLRPSIHAAPGQFGGANGTAGFRDALLFTLGPEVSGHPGYYELLPVR